MVRKDFYLREDQVEFLSKLQGQMTDHIRQAVDDYIFKLKSVNVSASQSKAGDSHE